MNSIIIANYIRFKTKLGNYVTGANYQNFFVEESRTFNETVYKFAPFRISGVISSSGGDNIQSSLTTIPNAITVGFAAEAALNTFMMEVSTLYVMATNLVTTGGNQLVGLSPSTFTEGGVIANELWMCGGMSQDYEKISISLISPLDATREQVPRRVLSESLIGSAPSSGTISSR